MALSADRNTIEQDGHLTQLPVAAGVAIYNGALVNVDTAGNARPARTTSTDYCWGIAQEQVVNIGGAGAKTVKVLTDMAAWLANSAVNAVADTERGQLCYVEDDQTVCTVAGSSVAAGVILDVDSTRGVLVRLSPFNGAIQAWPANLTVAGNLAVTGTSTLTGAAYANGGLDRSAAAALAIGATNATAVNVAKTGVTTNALGPLVAAEGCSVTTGKLKAVGVLATDGLEAGYSSANTGAPPTIAECTAAFGAPAAGRNGFVGILHDTGGLGYLVFISNGVYSTIAGTTAL